jgi:hypothetical protein
MKVYNLVVKSAQSLVKMSVALTVVQLVFQMVVMTVWMLVG